MLASLMSELFKNNDSKIYFIKGIVHENLLKMSKM